MQENKTDDIQDNTAYVFPLVDLSRTIMSEACSKLRYGYPEYQSTRGDGLP